MEVQIKRFSHYCFYFLIIILYLAEMQIRKAAEKDALVARERVASLEMKVMATAKETHELVNLEKIKSIFIVFSLL